MTQLRIHRHPFADQPPEVIEVESIGQWLVDHFEKAGAPVGLQVFRGEPSAGTEISRDVPALLASDAPYYTVLQSPGANPVMWWQAFQVIMAVYAVASTLMASKPNMPANVNRTQESPNNALGTRENQVRLLQRVEDIYGTVKAIPSLMMPTYNKYVDSVKVEYGYYCVGRGYHDISEIRDGDTLMSSITGASAAVYYPFSSPNSGAPFIQVGPSIIDRVLSVRRAVEVDGITLKAQNQIQLDPNSGYALLPPGPEREFGFLVQGVRVPASSSDRIAQNLRRPNLSAVVQIGQTVTIVAPNRTYFASGRISVSGAYGQYSDLGEGGEIFSGVVVGQTITFEGFTEPGNNGTFTVASKPGPLSITVTGGAQADEITVSPVSVTMHVNGAVFSGTRTVTDVGDGWAILSGASFPGEFIDLLGVLPDRVTVTANNGLVDWTDWVVQPTADRSETWVNVVAQNGMYKDGGGRSRASVAYAMELQQLDGSLNPTGGVVTVTGSLTGITTEERAETLEYATGWTGPTRVRMRRLTPYDYAFSGTVIDEVKWADLYAVSPVTRAHFGNKTTVHTVTQATSRSTAVKQRQLNCIATRRIPIWTGSGFSGGYDPDGRHAWGELYGTRFAHHIIAAVAMDPKIGNRPASDLDMPQISGVVDQLYAIHPEAPTFNYTFDSDNMSFEETVQTIANACFSSAYRQSGKIRLALDRKQDNSAALFTHRNKEPGVETLTRTFANDSAYDGIEFVYQDPGTLQAETIRLPVDGSATKAKKFEIPGIRSFAQAWLRANREYRKLRGQRLSIETSCTTDARLLLPNTRIDIVDNTRFKSYDGEVVAQDGLLLTLSQRVHFGTGSHSIVLMRRDGSLQGITVTAVPGRDDQVLLQSLPTEEVVTRGGVDGVRTIYSFASDDSRHRQAWLVGEIDPPQNNYVTVRAVNYSPTYYEMDTQPIPARDTVIN
jgi:hypothetical protein